MHDPVILKDLAKAIVVHENGRPPKNRTPCWYEDTKYDAACNLALDV